MPIDKSAYKNLEQRFNNQVISDRLHQEGRGYYLPSVMPKNKVNYIFVGMEPSNPKGLCNKDGEEAVEDGYKNFSAFDPPCKAEKYATSATDPVTLFNISIARFLCQDEKPYYLTDVSKGAMLGGIARLNRPQRWQGWYPLLLEEFDIVGEPNAPIIAIGKAVENFLRKNDLKGKTGRSLYSVLHYSPQAAKHRKREPARDPEGFEAFKNEEFVERGRWAQGLSLSKMQLIFTYKKQLGRIKDKVSSAPSTPQ